MVMVNGVETGAPAAGAAPAAGIAAPAPGSEEAKAAAATAAAAAAPAKDEAGNLMDDAAKAAKATTDAENTRLLEAKDEDLSEADKTKKAELVKANAVAEAAKGAPEKYEFKVPEGFTLDQALVDKFTPIAKKLNLNQAGAQELVDMYSGIVQGTVDAQATSFKTFVEGLKSETIKALGADYKVQLADAAKSRDRFATPELIEKLNESGLSNDKDMINLFIKIGKAISEDKPPEGPAGAGSKKDPAEVLFPSTVKK